MDLVAENISRLFYDNSKVARYNNLALGAMTNTDIHLTKQREV